MSGVFKKQAGSFTVSTSVEDSFLTTDSTHNNTCHTTFTYLAGADLSSPQSGSHVQLTNAQLREVRVLRTHTVWRVRHRRKSRLANVTTDITEDQIFLVVCATMEVNF